MSRKNKVKLSYSKNRVVLSDVLPYEIPPIFSNRFFYNFLSSNKIEWDVSKSRIIWSEQGHNRSLKEQRVFEKVIRLLFSPVGININNGTLHEENSGKSSLNVGKTDRIPFSFDIEHNNGQLRRLSLPHVLNQVQLVQFYEEYKDLMIYYSSISKYSIRKPVSVAKNFFYKDKTHYKSLTAESVISIEELGSEYESLNSFFVYERYSNIYKFFESPFYHRAEKRYNKLLKLDISKCFDSIYTHSLSWALLGKLFTKSSIGPKKEGSFFSGKFDSLMQNLNYQETNGIIIGSEFSRIFAELILQKVDVDLEKTLLELEPKLKHGSDYEVYRYVDDYFIFFNEDIHKSIIEQQLQLALKEYKLSFNEQKYRLYEKPIITEITIAKNKISSLMNSIKFETKEIEDGNGAFIKEGSIYLKATDLIVNFKTILKLSGADYKEVLNYTLSSLENKVENILETYMSIQNPQDKQLTKAFSELVEFMFFIYSSAPRVSYSIKVCRIIQSVIVFYNKNISNKDLKHHLFKEISDNINFLLNKNKSDLRVYVETMYLLTTLSELGRTYKLTQTTLASHFGFTKIDERIEYQEGISLDYFSIVTLLFYMKNFKDYVALKKAVESTILNKFKNSHNEYKNKGSELTFLLFDTLSCPYVKTELKVKILKIYGLKGSTIEEKGLLNDIVDFCSKQYWFTKWTGVNLKKELEAKRSLDVY